MRGQYTAEDGTILRRSSGNVYIRELEPEGPEVFVVGLFEDNKYLLGQTP